MAQRLLFVPSSLPRPPLSLAFFFCFCCFHLFWWMAAVMAISRGRADESLDLAGGGRRDIIIFASLRALTYHTPTWQGKK